MDNYTDKLIAYFDNIIGLKDEEQHIVRKVFRARQIKRRQLILNAGDICNYHTFVVKGCLKMFRYDQQGKELNLLFAAENDWIADLESLHNIRPSSLFIKAIEPSVILQIQRKELWDLYTRFPRFDKIFRVIIENKSIELQNHIFLIISCTGYERYDTFSRQYPHLLNRLPNTQIASFLGITPEFLSKIRSERLRRK